jgi:hypothetical protein
VRNGGPEQAIADSRVRGKARAAVLYLVLTLLLAYPLSIRPGSSVLGDDPDIHLFMWTLAWNTHAFVHQPLSIFDANIFHPYRHTLAYSENLIGSALFAAPILWLTDNPVLALNLVALLSCVLCGLGAYVLARRLGMGQAGALLCGLIFAFSPARFFRISQAHLTAVQWVPFTLASLHAYLDGGRRRDLRLAAAFFTLQVITTGHGAVFVTFSAVALLAYRVALGEPLAFGRRLRDLGVPGVLLLVPSVLIFLPYRRVQEEVGLRRGLHEWAPTPESFLASPTHLHSFILSLFPDARVNELAYAFLFPGYLPLLLAAVAVLSGGAALVYRARLSPSGFWPRVAFLLEIAVLASLVVAVIVTAFGPIRLGWGTTLLFSAREAWRPWLICAAAAALRMALASRVPLEVGPRLVRHGTAWRHRLAAGRRSAVAFYGLLTLASVWLSVGPPLGLWPLVYWLPGLNFIRVPYRFMILAVLGLAVLAGFGFERLSARLAPWRRGLFATMLGALLVAEFMAIPLRIVPYRVDIPGADRWLARRPTPFVVAEVPVVLYDRYQTTYMLHSMAHWQRTVHGYSGILPALHAQLYRQLQTFPDETSVQALRDLGVDYVVVHIDLYEPGEWQEVHDRLAAFTEWLTLEYVGRGGRVYSLRGAPATSRTERDGPG